MKILSTSLAVVVLTSSAVAQQPARTSKAAVAVKATVVASKPEQRIAELKRISAGLAEAEGRISERLRHKDRATTDDPDAKYVAWLEKSSEAVEDLTGRWEKAIAAGEDSKEFEAEYHRLAQQMHRESQRFQTVSNAMKASHEAAMNSIRNMK